MGIQKPNMQALWADQGAIIAPTDSKVRLGWTAEVPPNQWENWVQNRQDRALAYLMQKGIPEWDSATEYIANKSFVQKDGKIYKCIATNTGNDPATSTTFWDGGLGLGLGTAAYSSLTTSSTDTTAGRVLKVGDYGIGTQSTLPDGTGFSTLPVGGNYQISGNHLDAPSAGGGSLHVGGSSSLKTYLYIQNNTRKVYVKSGTSQWTELWSGMNFNPSDKADKTTTISAGTGLSGGGNLSQNRSLSVVYGTTANTAAQGNDPRIIGAAQRSELGTAATRDVMASTGDAITGRVYTTGNSVSMARAARDVAMANFSAVNNADNAWNSPQNAQARFQQNNNMLSIIVSGLNNEREAGIRSGHASIEYASALGKLHLNPLGGEVLINKNTAWHSGNFPRVTWNSLTGKPSVFPSNWANVADKPATATRWPAWGEVSGKPTTFPPSSHTHPWSQITGAPATATRWPSWGEVTDKPSGFMPPTTHGAVGTYAGVIYRTPEVSSVPWGATVTGSNLSPADFGDITRGAGTLSPALSGTWRIVSARLIRGQDSTGAYYRSPAIAVRIV